MSMDQAYQSWYQQADNLHYKVQDCFDQPDHQACQQLKLRMRDLINDLAQNRSPRDIEVRIQGIIDLLEPARNGSQQFMSLDHAVTYHDTFERMRREVHAHQHYN